MIGTTGTTGFVGIKHVSSYFNAFSEQFPELEVDGAYIWDSLVLIFITLFVFVCVTLAAVDTAHAKE